MYIYTFEQISLYFLFIIRFFFCCCCKFVFLEHLFLFLVRCYACQLILLFSKMRKKNNKTLEIHSLIGSKFIGFFFCVQKLNTFFCYSWACKFVFLFKNRFNKDFKRPAIAYHCRQASILFDVISSWI